MAFLVATTSLPAVYRPNGYARTTTAGTPHACANNLPNKAYYTKPPTKVLENKLNKDTINCRASQSLP